jgi:hypothetical protein
MKNTENEVLTVVGKQISAVYTGLVRRLDPAIAAGFAGSFYRSSNTL